MQVSDTLVLMHFILLSFSNLYIYNVGLLQYVLFFFKIQFFLTDSDLHSSTVTRL